MYRSLVLVLGIACALGVAALVTAPEEAPEAEDPHEVACATPVNGTPAGEMATPEAATPVMASPVASPDASPEACPTPAETGTTGTTTGTTSFTVTMIDILFEPKAFTIPANTDVTVELPNNGAAIHNFHIDALNVHSPDVAPGGTASVTINAPAGTYEYYCSIPGHAPAGMVGTLTVQ